MKIMERKALRRLRPDHDEMTVTMKHSAVHLLLPAQLKNDDGGANEEPTMCDNFKANYGRKGIEVSAVKMCSDQHEIRLTVKDSAVPMPNPAQLKVNDCSADEEPTMLDDCKANYGKTLNGDEEARKDVFDANAKNIVEANRANLVALQARVAALERAYESSASDDNLLGKATGQGVNNATPCAGCMKLSFDNCRCHRCARPWAANGSQAMFGMQAMPFPHLPPMFGMQRQ